MHTQNVSQSPDIVLNGYLVEKEMGKMCISITHLSIELNAQPLCACDADVSRLHRVVGVGVGALL